MLVDTKFRDNLKDSAISYQLSVISYQLSAISYQPKACSHATGMAQG
ncbi:MAG: hypothetical protein F6J98_34110 [Moorea sp. SIO4G2]|nr:hypothetical protein [Moorena sp. SIO4G2]